jgi:hypothetical protein
MALPALIAQRQRVALAGARTIEACTAGIEALLDPAGLTSTLAEAGVRGFFRPNEDELLREWFARFLNLRHALWEVLEDSVIAMGGEQPRGRAVEGWRCFLVGYAAASLVVRLDLHLVDEVADSSDIQRKLNEGDARYGLARKQFTRVFESISDPEQAWQMRAAIKFVQERREHIETLGQDEVVGPIVRDLERLEQALDPSPSRYLALAARFAKHAFSRRAASARQKAAFGLLESGGRVVSELRDHWTPKRVSNEIRAQCERLLRPGDVIVTRHDIAFTNVFLPGFWPHAALYIGGPRDAGSLGVRLDAERARRWTPQVRTLEALKDGVRLRPLDQTLGVDAFVLLRPRLSEDAIARGIERALQHEGKPYNFDFDFFRSDRLVCTEVIYRAFDGIDGLEIPLTERAGRPALSAEDLIDLALDTDAFEPVGLFGVDGCEDTLLTGPDLSARVASSYRPT